MKILKVLFKFSKNLIILFPLFWTTESLAQWECRSQLSSSLKPIGKSSIYWATELTGGIGYLDNNLILNSMGFLGVDISNKKSTLFVETGYKFWDRYDFTNDINFNNGHFGVRELFYQYRWKSGRVTMGVQSARFDDDYLLNERFLGINIKNNKGPWSINFNAGSVIRGFARNGIFCSVGYLYDIIPGRSVGIIGDSPGKSNLAGITLKYSPNKKKSEFSSNNSQFSLGSLGVLLYGEFGSWIEEPFVLSGMFADIKLPNSFTFKPEVIYQSSKLNNALIYSMGIEKEYKLNQTRTNIDLRYLGFSSIDENARVLNSYSNLFAGDVLRLDSRDMPLLQISTKTSFKKIKTHIKFQYSSQIKSSPMNEFDFELGKRFNKHLQINAIGAYIQSNNLPENIIMGRVECRISF